jgi:hypothetical protein
MLRILDLNVPSEWWRSASAYSSSSDSGCDWVRLGRGEVLCKGGMGLKSDSGLVCRPLGAGGDCPRVGYGRAVRVAAAILGGVRNTPPEEEKLASRAPG